jgi:hypothetical protein
LFLKKLLLFVVMLLQQHTLFFFIDPKINLPDGRQVQGDRFNIMTNFKFQMTNKIPACGRQANAKCPIKYPAYADRLISNSKS